MRDGPDYEDAHMHPALRDRVLQVSTDSRLRFFALSSVGVAKLNKMIAYFENLTPATSPDLSWSEYQLAGVIAKTLRLVCGRLTAWENGELPTSADAALMVDCLNECRRSLAKWADLLNDIGHS